jgi:hypothetical protein
MRYFLGGLVETVWPGSVYTVDRKCMLYMMDLLVVVDFFQTSVKGT